MLREILAPYCVVPGDVFLSCLRGQLWTGIISY